MKEFGTIHEVDDIETYGLAYGTEWITQDYLARY
jgi:hypothetical protein